MAKVSPEVLRGYATTVRALRTALRADGVGVLLLAPGGHTVAVADIDELDISAAMAGLVDEVKRSGRTALRSSRPWVVLAPIVVDGSLIGGLFTVRMGGGFTGPEVANVNVVAQELGRHTTGGSVAPTPLQPETVANAFGLEDPSSVVWGESDDETEAMVGQSSGPMLAFGDLNSTRLISADGLRDLLARTVHTLLADTEAHVAAVVLADSEPFSVLAIASTAAAPEVNATRLISRTVVGRVLETSLPMLTLDAQGDHVSAGAGSVYGLAVTTIMCVPLLDENSHAVGALYSATFSLGGRFDPATLAKIVADAEALTPMLKSLGQLTR